MGTTKLIRSGGPVGAGFRGLGLVEEGASDLVSRVGMLPFVYTPLNVPTNGCDLPDLLPFGLTFDKRTGSFLQMANEAVSSALAKAYAKGSMISGMMEEGGIGREYAEDFLRFLRESLGRERFDGANVLEIGCGTGYLPHRLKLLGATVLGLEPGATIAGINGPAEKIVIGDHSLLAHDTKVRVPSLKIGDYVQIHNHSLLYGYAPLTMGQNVWVGQNTILNGTARLTLGNNVGVGAYSQLWTHIQHGNAMEGCRFDARKEMIVEDDV